MLLYRILMVTPAANCAAVNAFIKAEIDPEGDDWLTPRLSANGLAPATHAWTSFALDDDAGKKLLGFLSQRSGLPIPSQWDSWNRTQKKQWLTAAKETILAATGSLIIAMDNDGNWADPYQIIAGRGWKEISGA